VTPQALCVVTQLAAHLLQLLRDDPRMMDQRRSYRREPNASPLPLQQWSAERLLHGTDPLAGRCQSHVRARRPMRDAGSFGDVEEQSEVR